MLIHKAAYVILCWEWAHTWLRLNGNPCLIYGHNVECFVHNIQPVTVLTAVQCLFATSNCYLHHTVSAEAESFLQVSGTQGQPAFRYPISVAATHPFKLFCWHLRGSWFFLLVVKSFGSASCIHKSTGAARFACTCTSGASFPLLMQ